MTTEILEKQISEFVNSLRDTNKEAEKRGVRKITDQEYEVLKNKLIKKAIRSK